MKSVNTVKPERFKTFTAVAAYESGTRISVFVVDIKVILSKKFFLIPRDPNEFLMVLKLVCFMLAT